MTSYYEASARERLAGLLDPRSFRELLPPVERLQSPHLGQFGIPGAFDDGIIVGDGLLDGRPVLVAAQEGGFMGGAVGEIHGAKLTGLLGRALKSRPAAVLLLAESGGVRLHEANAGLIGASEIMRAVLTARAAGIPVFALIGGQFGCFGAMGIIARLCDCVIMSEEGRLGLSGPEVIETACGVEEFDARDRALVWRTTGGKHRYLLGEAAALVTDDIAAFRAAAIQRLGLAASLSLEPVEDEHTRLGERLRRFGGCPDAFHIWRELGFQQPERLPFLDAQAFLAAALGKIPGDIPGAPPPGAASHAMTTAASMPPTPDASAPDAETLLNRLFPDGHSVGFDGVLFSGSGKCGQTMTAVLGAICHTPIGVELAHRLASDTLAVIRNYPGRPILLLIDTQGQRLSFRDELLGLNGYMAHLAKCIDLAGRRGHRLLSLVWSEAVSGGFLATGLMADACYALPEAEIRVMNLAAIARIAKIPLAQLDELSKNSPVFAPGAANFHHMGAISEIWRGDLGERLAEALAAPPENIRRDDRRELGESRGGRLLARLVSEKVRSDGLR
jgi:malonate decarboxylase beta subunit